MSLALRLSRVELDGDDFAEVHGRIDELIAAGELEHEGRSLKVVTPLQQLGGCLARLTLARKVVGT